MSDIVFNHHWLLTNLNKSEEHKTCVVHPFSLNTSNGRLHDLFFHFLHKNLIGKWQSVHLRKAIGDYEKIEFTFRKDGSFTGNGVIKGEEVETYNGTYSIEGDKLRMKVPGEADRLVSCHIRNGRLVMNDSGIEFERVLGERTIDP